MSKYCNRCGNKIEEYEIGVKDYVNNKTVCNHCLTNFYYDTSKKEWFYSISYGLTSKQVKTSMMRRLISKKVNEV